MHYISVDLSQATLRRIYGANFTWYSSMLSTTLPISPSSSSTSSDNVLAYRPNYLDSHGSNLAALFVNLEALHPCIGTMDYAISCKLFTYEEDGFRQGRSIIEAADNGNSIVIFDQNVNMATYGFALEGCAQFDSSCFNYNLQLNLVCLLPRSLCANNR